MVGGCYVPDVLIDDDFCPLWPPSAAVGPHLTTWQDDGDGRALTAFLQAVLDRCAASTPLRCQYSMHTQHGGVSVPSGV